MFNFLLFLFFLYHHICFFLCNPRISPTTTLLRLTLTGRRPIYRDLREFPEVPYQSIVHIGYLKVPLLNYLTYQYSTYTLVTVRWPFSCDLASKKLRRKKQGRREGESETRTNPILTRSSRAGQFGQLQQPLSTSELDRTWDIQLPTTTLFLSG